MNWTAHEQDVMQRAYRDAGAGNQPGMTASRHVLAVADCAVALRADRGGMSASPSPKAVTSALDKAEHGTAFKVDVDALRGHIQAQAAKIADLEARVRTLELQAQGAMAASAAYRTAAETLKRERDTAASRSTDMESSRHEWQRRAAVAEKTAATFQIERDAAQHLALANAGRAADLESDRNEWRRRAEAAEGSAKELAASVEHAQAVNLADLMRQEKDLATLQLTLRDEFAMRALTSIIALDINGTYAEDANEAYVFADAMIAEREKTK